MAGGLPAQSGVRRETITGASAGDGFPDQFGHIDDQILFGLVWSAPNCGAVLLGE